jgi:hypothetical protein
MKTRDLLLILLLLWLVFRRFVAGAMPESKSQVIAPLVIPKQIQQIADKIKSGLGSSNPKLDQIKGSSSGPVVNPVEKPAEASKPISNSLIKTGSSVKLPVKPVFQYSGISLKDQGLKDKLMISKPSMMR